MLLDLSFTVRDVPVLAPASSALGLSAPRGAPLPGGGPGGGTWLAAAKDETVLMYDPPASAVGKCHALVYKPLSGTGKMFRHAMNADNEMFAPPPTR
jgi:hypothetical protein